MKAVKCKSVATGRGDDDQDCDSGLMSSGTGGVILQAGVTGCAVARGVGGFFSIAM